MIGLAHYLTVAGMMRTGVGVKGEAFKAARTGKLWAGHGLFALTLCHFAFPAAAYEPAAPCRTLTCDESLVSWDSLTALLSTDIFPSSEEGGFVLFWRIDPADGLHVGLQQRPSDDTLLVSCPRDAQSG
jgi:hypothetical protein